MTREKQVRHVLFEQPETRNCDKELMIGVWKAFYKRFLYEDQWVSLAHITELPGLDSIARIRRKVQEAGDYLPTDEKIARRRAQQALKVRKNIHTPYYAEYLPL